MDISQNKQKVIDEIEEKICELKHQKKLIENLDIEPITITEWMELCKTPLRYNDILLELAKATFPNGYDFKRTPNHVCFKIKDIEIRVPTYSSSTINIDMSWYSNKDIVFQKLNISMRYSHMRKYFELLDSGNYTWYDLAKCRCEIAPYRYSKFKLFIWWFTKGRKLEVNREYWEKIFELEDEKNELALKTIEEYNNIVKKKLENLHEEVIPTLSSFSQVQGRVGMKWLKQKELMELK